MADLQELVMSAAPLAHPVLQLALHLRTLLALIHTDCPAASLHCSASTIPSLSCRPLPHAQAQAPSCPEEAEALAAAAYANAAAPVAPLPLSRPETAPVPAAQQPRRPPPLAWVQQQQQLQEEEQLLPAAQQQLLDQQQLQPLLSPVMHQAPPKQQPAAFARRPVVPAAPQPSLRSRPSSAMVSESGGIMPLNHYLQNMISPRSRSEYDAFNRFHFSRQQQAGRDPRAVTPKVCMYAGLPELALPPSSPDTQHCLVVTPVLGLTWHSSQGHMCLSYKSYLHSTRCLALRSLARCVCRLVRSRSIAARWRHFVQSWPAHAPLQRLRCAFSHHK